MENGQDFDPSKLDELKDYKDELDRDLRFSLVDIYMSESAKLIAQLKKAQTFEERSSVAHSLKSSTAAIGGTTLAALFAKIEREQLSPFEVTKALKEVEQLFSQLNTSLQAYIKTAA